MRKQQSSFQWVAHDAVRTTLLHVGGVSLDVPGTLMQAGGREGGKEGSKEGNWNGQHFLCWDVAVGWILNTDYCSPTFGWSKVRELDSQGISESAVLSRLRTCVQKTRRNRKWHLVIRWRNRAWPCFVLSVGFLFVTTSEMVRFLSRFREWRWRCEPVRRRIALRSNCSQRPAAGFLSSAVLIYCPSHRDDRVNSCCRKTFCVKWENLFLGFPNSFCFYNRVKFQCYNRLENVTVGRLFLLKSARRTVVFIKQSRSVSDRHSLSFSVQATRSLEIFWQRVDWYRFFQYQ